MKLVLTNYDEYWEHRELIVKLFEYKDIDYHFEDNDGLDDFVIDLSKEIVLDVYNTVAAAQLLGAEIMIADEQLVLLDHIL
jgi:hypothetical protein